MCKYINTPMANLKVLNKGATLTKCLFKRTVMLDFVGPFMACMDRSGQEKEPLLVYKFFYYFLDFWWKFKVLKRLKPKHLEDSWNLRDGFTNVGSGSRRLPISFSEHR